MEYRSTEDGNSQEAGRCCPGGRVQQVLLAVMILCVHHPASSHNLSTQLDPQDLIIEKDATILKLPPGYYRFGSEAHHRYYPVRSLPTLPPTLCTVEGSYDSSMVPRILLAAPLSFTCPKVTFYGFLKLEAPTSGPPIEVKGRCVNGHSLRIAETADITFLNCHTAYLGGALSADSLDVAGNITFNNCSAQTNVGGAVSVDRDLNIFKGAIATFNDCWAGKGGGLYLGGVLKVSGSAAFKGCWATQSGGGLFGLGSVIVSGSTTFHHCRAGASGGGLGIYSFTVSGSAAFKGCVSHASGGGLWANLVNISGSAAFAGCKADDVGGGLTAATVHISGSAAFESCQARLRPEAGTELGGGGAFATEDVIIQKLAKATFRDCNVSLGGSGGGLLAQGVLRVFGSIAFENCRSDPVMEEVVAEAYKNANGQIGGGALVHEVIIGKLGKASFYNCGALFGGGLGILGGMLSVYGSIAFERCQSGDSGGGAFLDHDVTIGDLGQATFKDCKAKVGGGGLYGYDVAGYVTLDVFGSLAFIGCEATSGPSERPITPMGGGAFISHVIIRTLAKVIFKDCRSYFQAGGLQVLGLNVYGSVAFENCEAGTGGGVVAQNVVIRNFAKATFTDCKAESEGGGLIVVSTLALFGTSTFTNCRSDSTGGGLQILGNMSLENASFINCSAKVGAAAFSQGDSISLAGDIRFDHCHSLGGIGSGLAVEDPFHTQVTAESNLRLSFTNMCTHPGSETLMWANFGLVPKFSAELFGTSGKIPVLDASSHLYCMTCPFGTFSFEVDTRLGSICTECESFYKDVYTDLSSFPCAGNEVRVPDGVMLTEQNGRYDAWICPNKDVCKAMTINTSADVDECAPGYNSSATLPACGTCSDGYGSSQYDPFVCLKCSSSKMSLITPLLFYLLAIYSAGQKRKPMAAIQNIIISFVTTSTSSLAVLRDSSSVQDLENTIQAYINTMIDFGNVPIYSPSSACLFPICNNFECAPNEIALILGLGFLYYPFAEIVHRVAAWRGSYFGPQGKFRVRLMVQAAIASNYFMPTLMGVVLKFMPCAVIQNKEHGDHVERAAWFWAETCASPKRRLWQMLAILGAILCIAFGPVYHCFMITRSERWSEDEREDALGFTLSIYSDESKFGKLAKYWDAMIILRKMLFISASMLFPLTYNASQFSLATLGVISISLILQLYVRPYRKRDSGIQMNFLEDLSLITSLVSLLLSLSIKDSIHPSLPHTVITLAAIALINTAALMVMMYSFFSAALNDGSVKSMLHKIESFMSKRELEIESSFKIADNGRPNQPLLSQTRDLVPGQERQTKSVDALAILKSKYPRIDLLDGRLADLNSRIDALEGSFA